MSDYYEIKPETTEPEKEDIEHVRKFNATFKENIKYEINTYKKGTHFIIETEIEDTKYSNSYELEPLKKSNKYLALNDNIDDLIDTIYENASNNNCNLIENHNDYEVKIPVPVKSIREISFILKEQKKSQSEIINDLLKSSKFLKKKNSELEMKIKSLEEENEKIKSELKEIKTLINELKNEKEKISNVEVNPIINSKSKLINNLLFKQLNKWINPLKSLNFELIFTASINGDRAENFHQNCDGKGPTVTIIKAKNGNIFGAYLTVPFSSDHQSHSDETAFLFSLTNMKKFPIKNKKYAVCHYSNWGPYIGYQESCDLAIKEGCLKNKSSYCVPTSYEFNRVDLIGKNDKFFEVEDYEVYLVN